MAAGLGLGIGSTTSIAVSTASSGSTKDARTLVVPTVLRLEPGREPVLANGFGGGSVLTGFTGRVGDPVSLVADDGSTHTGDELCAAMLARLAERAKDEGAPDDSAVVVTHPTGWQPYTVDRLRDATSGHGLTDVTFVPEAIAAVAWLQRGDDAVHGDGTVVVYDLGGSVLDVAVVRTGTESRIVGRGARSEDISGAHFDHLVLAHVLESVPQELDPFDPATVEALAVLRTECARAKEALSSDTETVVPVRLPGVETDVRLVRSEVEELFRDTVESSLDVVDEALRSAGLTVDDVTRVLLTGGGAAIPLVTEAVSAALRVPLTASADPASTSAVGAAVLAAEIAEASGELDRVGAAPVPVADEPVTAPTRVVSAAAAELPTRTATSHAKKSSGKRVAVIAGAAIAIAVLAAGGLSASTGLIGGTDPETSSVVVEDAASEDAIDTDPTAGEDGTPVSADTAGTGDAAGDARPGTADSAPAGTPGSGSAANDAAVPGGAAPAPAAGGSSGAGSNPATAPTAPGVQAPAVQAPSPTRAPAAPAPVPTRAPAPVPQLPAPQLPAPQFPSNPLPGVVGGVTDGLGNTVGRVGEGAGNVVGGVLQVPGRILGN